ncbi:hypothetical protein [Aquimarina agarilytica]|uniref:hypothetical protein n=1 Tax=Aquimarina agarilytica TaxID=1087449 RepID=UPI000288543A|nr:hypothetical protein [Aquimarina agarilytica]
MKIDILKLVGIVFSSMGFWKLIELLFQYRIHKQFKTAEIQNLNAQANNTVVKNWVQWSEKMEKRIEKLESENAQMNETIIKQKQRINELEEEIRQYKK